MVLNIVSLWLLLVLILFCVDSVSTRENIVDAVAILTVEEGMYKWGRSKIILS